MTKNHENCGNLFEAGKALVEKSRLAHFSGLNFAACENKAALEEYWCSEFHPEFGRYMAWVLLSVGAENLAKAACVCSGIVKAAWTSTIDDYLKTHFEGLYKSSEISDVDLDLLKSKYAKIKKVRDTEVHSFRKNRRAAIFSSVAGDFTPAFNILIESMRKAGHPL